MTSRTLANWLVPVLLAVPLLALCVWIVAGWFGAPPEAPAAAAPPAPVSTGTAIPGLPKPEADLERDRLEDRVDGAAEFLRGLGCRRLVYWRLDDPAADLELLVFDRSEGAAQALARDAGSGRTAGPGDEAQVGEQAVFFRRGPYFVRLFADPGVPAKKGVLAGRAEELDRALARTGGQAG